MLTDFCFPLVIVQCLTDTIALAEDYNKIAILKYYIQPCIFLLYGSDKLLNLVLKLFDSLVLDIDCSLVSQCDDNHVLKHARMVLEVACILNFMHHDVELHRGLSSSRVTIKHILLKISKLLVSLATNCHAYYVAYFISSHSGGELENGLEMYKSMK